MSWEPSEAPREGGGDRVPLPISFEPSLLSLRHKCSQTAQDLGTPLSFSVTALRLVSFPFLLRYQLRHYHLQPRSLRMLLTWLLGLSPDDLCGDERGLPPGRKHASSASPLPPATAPTFLALSSFPRPPPPRPQPAQLLYLMLPCYG